MPCSGEYHVLVRLRIPASVALFGVLGIPAVFVSISFAQAGGAAASANSSGASGHSFASAPATSTAAGSHSFSTQSSGNAPAKSGPSANSGQFHHRHHEGDHIGEVYALPIPYPIAVGAPENEAEAEESDAEYQGGPTIFDRRGFGPDSYVPPVKKVPTPHSGVSSAALSVPDVAQEPTLLIFKDGHKLEVENYAIVGANLVDLTPGHQRTVALADLDLGATHRQNNERGVIFLGPRQVPRVN